MYIYVCIYVYIQGTDIFIIEAKLPVVESFGMVGELRKQTSGPCVLQYVLQYVALCCSVLQCS